jgi:hypothetical protein
MRPGLPPNWGTGRDKPTGNTKGVKKMKKMRKITRDKKGIDTILAALLMVVIVVVAAVMVYAWATGLLGTLLVHPTTGNEVLNLENSAFNSNQNVTLDLRNAGSASISLTSFYVKNSTGGQWAQLNWQSQPHPPAAIAPNALGVVYIAIGSGTLGNAGPCDATGSTTTPCSESGSGFGAFTSGYSYTITVITSRNNQFQFTVTR